MLNFEPEDIKVNESALEEMVRTRKESLFSWQQPLVELNSISICLINIRSWNGHLEYFLSDSIYSAYTSQFCFTETNISHSPGKQIIEILDDCKDIQKNTT